MTNMNHHLLPDVSDDEILSVSALNNLAKNLLEGAFPRIWIEGEIGNFSRPSSGHMYFTLKDSQAQVRCAMFRGDNYGLRFSPNSGMQVLAHAEISLYAARGEYQLIVRHMEEAGFGRLKQQFEALKNKLAAEGLFADTNKQALPTEIRRIGVITSPTGAALQDILSVLNRRNPGIEVVIYPAAVQGEHAAESLINMLIKAEKRHECDVLLLSRGGGSMEDLWCFNDEGLARMIHQCPIPIVSAVGHEVDFTIADFVADVRAPTPSAAAELLSADSAQHQITLNRLYSRLVELMQGQLYHQQQQLSWITKHLQTLHPGKQLEATFQRLDELELRLKQSVDNTINQYQHKTNLLKSKLLSSTPKHKVISHTQRLSYLRAKLQGSTASAIERRNATLKLQAEKLNALSPLATMSRGFSIVRKTAGKKVITSTEQVNQDDKLDIQFSDGKLSTVVTKVTKNK